MGRKKVIERIEVRAHVHATEDLEKVGEAIANVLGLEELPEIEVIKARGHHGNPILTLHLVVKGKEAQRAFENLINGLDDVEFQILKSELPRRSEKSKLYLRVDKQRAYLGKLTLSTSSDVIWIMVVFKGARPSEELLERVRGESR